MSLPPQASVVVIGGGVMGCSTLYHLAREGAADAVLLERSKLTSGTTWHSAAQVRALRSSKNLTDLIRYSIDLYAQLERRTGQSVGWINKGSISIACNPDRLTHIRRQKALSDLFGLSAQLVEPEAAKERWPLMSADDVIGAVWSPEDGRVSPSDLCAALAKGAKSAGAKIFEDVSVTGILTRNGKVAGVDTSAGEIRCDAAVVCAGLWSREVARRAGVGAPLWPCEHFYLLTKDLDGLEGNLPTLSDHDSHLYFRDDSGGLLVGCFEPAGKAIDPESLGDDFSFRLLPEDWDHFGPMMENALRRVPGLAHAQVKALLNGPESFTPDGSFILGEATETPGLFLGCGMNSVGVATGGGAGHALARRIVQGCMPFALPEADPGRFPDCLNSASALGERVPEVLGRHYEIGYPGLQPSTARNLRLLPLHRSWVESDAHFGQHFGWERPLCFGPGGEPAPSFGRPAWHERAGREAMHAHEEAAVFDLSSLGKISVAGPDAESFLGRVCANDMSRGTDRVIYSVMLNDRGGIEGDLTALRLSSESYRLHVGTDQPRRTLAWLRKNLNDGERVILREETDQWAILALAGPKSARIAREAGAGDLENLGYYRHGPAEIAGCGAHAARISYVGEAGWEITSKAADAGKIWARLGELGARPAGLYAQSSMRIEKRFLSYGHDMDPDVTPLDAGLDFSLDWSKRFVGREALEARREKGARLKIVLLRLDSSDAFACGGEPVYAGDKILGRTTSAAYGHRMGSPLALALAENDSALRDEPLSVDLAGQKISCRAFDGPGFDPAGERMRKRG